MLLLGMDGISKFTNIFRIIVSISAIRSVSQLGVLSKYSLAKSASFKTVFGTNP
jgi:hypothetical protein